MSRYYFVVSSFPPIQLGQKSEMTYEKARQLVLFNVQKNDWNQVIQFQRAIDILNLRAFWLKQPIDLRGNFNEKELEEALLLPETLPRYLSQFLKRYESNEERMSQFSLLVSTFYRDIRSEVKGFLHRYYQFEREMRLCLTALRARNAKRDLLKELQWEDPLDPFVSQLIADRENPNFRLPGDYDDVMKVYLENISDPHKQYRALLQVRLSRIEEMESDEPFGMAPILGYLARLLAVETYYQFDFDQGRLALREVSA